MTNDFSDIVKILEKVGDIISRRDGQTLDLQKESIFSQGPFLHQNTGTMGEEESAVFERNNPELFAYLRSLDDEIEKLF